MATKEHTKFSTLLQEDVYLDAPEISKRVKIDGNAGQVRFCCANYDKNFALYNRSIYDRNLGRVTETIKLSRWLFFINDVEYRVIRRFRTAGGGYTETWWLENLPAYKYKSYKAFIEGVLKAAPQGWNAPFIKVNIPN